MFVVNGCRRFRATVNGGVRFALQMRMPCVSDQLGLEVERLYFHVELAQLGGTFVHLLADGFHVDHGHRLDFGARVAVLSRRGGVEDAAQVADAHGEHVLAGHELGEGDAFGVGGLHVGGIDAPDEIFELREAGVEFLHQLQGVFRGRVAFLHLHVVLYALSELLDALLQVFPDA